MNYIEVIRNQRSARQISGKLKIVFPLFKNQKRIRKWKKTRVLLRKYA